jgi:ubiquinol-cytochrome c reductase cytochrome c1 subunit
MNALGKITGCCLLLGLAVSAHAAEHQLAEVELPRDLPAIERGAETVATVCMGCHNLKYIKYRDLLHLGIAKEKLDEWRAGQPMDSALQAQMTEDAARASFNTVPPDLSLMAAAREGGGRYLFSYLTGYHMNEKGELTNSVFPETRMPDILGAADASEPQQRADLESKAKDVSAFLVWAADPHASERERLGYYVLAYIAILTLLLFIWKKQIWREIDKQPKIK